MISRYFSVRQTILLSPYTPELDFELNSQELVELGMMMRDAAKCRGINIPISGSLANVLVQYAGLLASQGYLEADEAYLSESQDVSLLLSHA